MSYLTNDREIYQETIRKNLNHQCHNGWKPLWSYFEMTQLLTYGFSITLLIKDKIVNRKLIYRYWNNESINKISSDLYDLNSIIISEIELKIMLNDIFQIQELIKNEIDTVEFKGVVLDGYFKEFSEYYNNKKITWNIDEEMNSYLSTLIEKILSLKHT